MFTVLVTTYTDPDHQTQYLHGILRYRQETTRICERRQKLFHLLSCAEYMPDERVRVRVRVGVGGARSKCPRGTLGFA